MSSSSQNINPSVVGSNNEADLKYLAEHNIPSLMNTLTKELFQDKPEDVIGFLLESLKRKRAERDAAPLMKKK
jgi:hypothetical protein